jgi:hypothetical protein
VVGVADSDRPDGARGGVTVNRARDATIMVLAIILLIDSLAQRLWGLAIVSLLGVFSFGYSVFQRKPSDGG